MVNPESHEYILNMNQSDKIQKMVERIESFKKLENAGMETAQ